MKVKKLIPVMLLAVVLVLICWFFIPFTYIKDGGSIEDIRVRFHDDEKDETGYYEDYKLSAEQEKAAAQILLKMKCTHKLNSFGAFQLRFYPFRIDCMADGKSCHIFLGKSGIVYDGTNGWTSEGRITNAEALTEEFRALLGLPA